MKKTHWLTGMLTLSKKRIVLGSAIIVMVIAFSAALFASTPAEDDQTVATINGEPIQVLEFMLILNNNYVAKTYNYFSTQYGVTNFKDFWSNVYGNEKPIDYAKNLALKEWIQLKSEQMLMKQYGVIGDISYASFVNELEKENNRRKAAVEKNQVIYGPVQFSDYQYFSHLFTTNENDLKKVLEREKFIITENDLKKEYENMKEEYFVGPYQVKVEKISMNKTEHAVEVMKELQTSIQTDNGLEKLKTSNKDLVVENQTFNEISAKTDYDVNPQLLLEAQKLRVGEVSPVIDENNRLTVMKCVAVNERGYQEYDKVKEQVKTKIINKKYEDMVQETIAHANVKIVDKVFSKLSVAQ